MLSFVGNGFILTAILKPNRAAVNQELALNTKACQDSSEAAVRITYFGNATCSRMNRKSDSQSAVESVKESVVRAYKVMPLRVTI